MKTYSNIEFPDIEFPKTLGLNPELELKDLTATINDMISKSLPSQGLYDKIIDALNYSMEVGGKRLRPILMLAAARLFIRLNLLVVILIAMILTVMILMAMILQMTIHQLRIRQRI